MPTGNMLIAGGVGVGGVPIATVEIRLTARDGTAADATSMSVARASHTATVLSNGRVLVTGGWNSGVTVLNTAEVYDPSANNWTATLNNMSAARFNHTATVLDSGLVLVCGGQVDFTPTVTATCDTYNPATNMFTPTVGNMQQGRAAHTATLLKNGRVWFAGGWNPGVNPNYLFTTERYDPTFGTFNSAAPLAQGRAFHTATMGGDGKVLIVGGLNSDNSVVNGNSYGFLPTVQLYDPVGNSMAPAAAMNTRRAMHATVLSSDGHIRAMGGLGNVATTYLLAPLIGNLLAGSNVTASFIPPTDYLTTGTISGGSLSLGLDFQIGTPVTGVIDDGEIVLSSPSVTFPDVQVLFTPGNADNPAQGLRIPLAGVSIGCNDPLVSVELSCGRITGNLSMSNIQGKLHTTPFDLALNGLAPPGTTGGSVNYAPTPLADGDIATITGGNVIVSMDLLVNPAFIGFSISSGSLTLASASIVKPTSITVTLDGGFGTFTSGVIVPNAEGTRGVVTVSVNIGNLSGQVVGEAEASAVASPQTLSGLQVQSFTGIVRIVPSGVNLVDQTFNVQTSTLIIRRMSFGSPEFYRPDDNEWDWIPPNGTAAVGAAFATIGPTATLMPNNDIVFWGGRLLPAGPPLTAQSRTLAFTGWAQGIDPMLQARALHTATVLPSGRILVAGGTNGPNILRTAEIFDPGAQEQFQETLSPMHDARDLHTATLLPNGRVLVAGGFTTNATSTGSTSSAEIFYPDTGVFLQAQPMISSRSNHTAVLLPDGNVMALGGFGDNDVITATTEIYYSTSGFWRAAPSMPTARTLHTATLLGDGRVVVAGGVNSGGVLNTVHAFNTLNGTWGALAPMPIALHSHSATRLFDGRILVAGGNNGLGEQDVSMIYDPSSDSWANTVLVATSALTMPRFSHNATLLPNGNVMISGGTQRFGQVTDVIEVFHTPIGAWADHGRFSGIPAHRAYHTMTLAPDGLLYALGGSNGTIGGAGTQLLSAFQQGHLSTTPDGVSVAGTPGFRRSTITATSPTPFLPNTLFTVVGTQFKGGTEASGGGAASANSSFSYPRLTLQSIDGGGGSGTQGQSGFIVDLTTQIYLNAGNLATLNSSVTVSLPATSAGLPFGWYGARISANDIHSPSRLVQVGPAKPTAAPGSVLGIPVGTSSMSWTWTAVPGVDGYAIYQTTTGVFVGTTPVTSYIQDGLAPNTTASIRVAGYTISGDGPLAQGATNFTLCTSPTNVTIASVTFANLLLHWNTNGNELGTIYEIQQSTDAFATSLSTPAPLALQITTNNFIITNLLQNTTYTFRVRGYNGAGNPGPFSLAVSTLTRAPVGGLDGSALSPTAIRWVWNNPGVGVNVVEYRVYNATTGVLISQVAPAVNPEYIDSPLGFNEARSVLVSVVTAAGEGPLTPSPTYFTLAQPPSLGPLPYLLPITATQLTGLWTFSGNPSQTEYRYRLYEIGGSTLPVGGTVELGTQISSHTTTGLTPATLYVGSVTAVNGNDIESSWLVLGATYTLAVPPVIQAGGVSGETPVSIDVAWDTMGNGFAATYELTYTTHPFFVSTVPIVAFIPFSSNFSGSSTTVTGLLTSTTYYFRVRAQTPFGTATAYSPTMQGFTFNGGAPAGSIAGTLSSLSPSQIVGSLGNGRQIDVRSPAGAFPSDVTMTISSYNVAGTLCPNGVNVAVSITNAPALQPLKPIFLNMSYTAGEIGAIPVNRLTLFRYEPVSGTCVPLETTASGGIVRAQINHFSLFQLGQTTLATTPNAARIFPNPFRTASDSYLTIDNVPPASKVKIFTLRGELVTDMTANASGIATWAANNGSGRAVASGLYLVMVEHGSNRKILKLSVLR